MANEFRYEFVFTGSRAYVLLSLTQDRQDEDSNDQKQHYADFENRAMVMEMFAETASGEEAHAVALDSVQLPQVIGLQVEAEKSENLL